MKTKEILQPEWPSFFDGFSRQHEGWLVSLELLGPEIGAQVEESELPFEGIVVDHDDYKNDKITIMMGATTDSHIAHTINLPTQVSLEQTDNGADVALAIRGENETTTLLTFRVAVLPETVDAVGA